MNYVSLVRSTFVRVATMVVALAALAASGTAQSPPPAPFISSPMNGIVYPSTSVFIGGTRDASVTSVEIFDGATSLGFATLGAGTFFGNWTLLDGVHVLTAVADDGLGNGTSTSNVVNLTVDTVAPVAPVITSSTPASPSNDATPVISGSAEGNATIVVSNGVSNLGTTVANPAGAWSVTLSNLADGNYVLTATATDLGGNVSAASAGFAMTIDTVAPAAPAITSVTPPSPSSVATPTLTGTAEANSTVTVKDGGVSIGNTPVDGSGHWTFTTSPLTEGVHALTACATDAAGNVSTLSPFAGYLVDTIAPPAPTISGSTPSSPSNVATPILSGTAEVSSTVTISEGANVLGTTTTSGAGTWTFTAPAFVDGTFAVTATATDGVGNVSSASSVFTLVIDTTAPAAPSIVSSTPASPTNVATPVLAGTSEAGAVITVGNGTTTVATTTADNAGNWSATTSTLADGTYSFTATSTDAAGNVSAPSSAFVVTIDTTAPAAPVIVASSPVSPTNVATPTLNGTAEASSTIVVSDGTSTIGTTTADNAGNWSVTLAAMTEGTYAFTATAADALGNVSVASTSFTFVIDTTAPNAPSIVASTPASPTNVTTPTLNGTAEASSTIIVTDGTSTVATTTADNAGNWSVTTSTLVDGTYSFTATSTDVAGNVSAASAAFALTVDTVAPTAPVFVTSSPTSPTNAATQSFGGTAEVGITVTVSNGSGVVGTTTADGSGNWTVTTAMTDGSWTMSANAVDAAGNVSTSSNVVAYVVDTTAPSAPAITATSPTSPANSGTPTISGTSEAGASIVVYAGASAVAFAAADGAGNWNATTTNMVDGTYVMTATATDAAGNASAPSTTFALVIDTTAPAVPTLASTNPVSPMNTVNPTAAGTAEAGSTVTVDDGFSTVGTTIADNAGNWTAVLTLSGEGQFTLRATSTDAAGNASPSSNGLIIDVDTTAPVAPVIASSTPASPSNIANPVLSGTAEANSTVTVSDGTSTVGTTTASAGGTWTMTTVLADGSYTLVATATDAVNNVSSPSATFALVVDTTAPAAPVFVAATPASPSNSGTPVITGTAEANATVIVTDGTATIATTTADNAGNWSIAPTFAEGSYTLTATATDAAANVSSASAAFTFVVDTTAPAAPVITASTPASPSNTGTPVIAGTAEANASVTVFDGTTTLAVTTADNSGNWTTTVTLADGTYMLTAIATDAAANVSPASSGFTVTVDATAPAAPVILASSPASPSNVANPTISGTAEANSIVNILDGAIVVGTVAADNVGNWSVTSTFVDGTYALTATATDAASNVSSASAAFALVVDTTAPAAPVFVASTPASPSNSGTPVITGTAEANATVVVSNGASVVATTTVDNAGNWSVAPTFVDGTYALTATATDAASNVSSASAAFALVVDTVAPAAPVIVASNPVSPSTSATPVLSGTAEAGASVIVTDGTSTIGTVVADGSGNWNVTLNLVDGTYAITATATDAALNVSTSSNVFPLVVDTAAPAIPTITGSSPASPANTGTPVISGTADANTLIVVSDGVSTVGNTTATASGTWSVTVTLADGSYTLTATASDGLGNTSPASSGFALVIDTTAPAAPVFVASAPVSPSNSNVPVISGTCEPNAAVNVFEGAVVIDTIFADNAGNWSSSPVFTDGTHTLTATATDAASNVSTASVAFTIVIDTVAPVAPVIGTSTPTSPSNSGSPVVAGTAEANASVVVSDGASIVASTTADNSGNWSVTATLVDGTHTLTATATDAASNVSTASAAFTIVVDTTAPSVPNGVAASSPTTTAPVLSWTASSDVTTSVATYNVRRDDGTGPVVVGTTSNTTFTDGTLTLGGTYTYTVSAVDAVGNESAPSNGAVVVYAIPLPSNILTVGPTGTYPTIAAAVTAAANLPSTAHAVIKVASGTYGEFAVNGAVLPSSTRIIAEDGATVVVTPVATPVTVSNVPWTKSFEMVGVNVIATSFAATPVSVFANDGTVHFRDGNWSSSVGIPTVSVALSAQAAFANLVLSGNFNATSNNVISMTSVSGMTLVANAGTTVTGFGSTFAAVNSDATSTVTTWTGAACNLSVTPRFATQNQAVTIDLAAGASNAGRMWVLAVSASPILHWNYNPVSTGSPLILGASFIANANLAIVDTRVTNVSGTDSLAVAGLNDPYYFGLPLVFQGVVLDATSSNFHVTTAATYVQLP